MAICYDLIVDDKYHNSDTIGFFGLPYHYFTFSFIQNISANNLVLKLDYNCALNTKKTEKYYTPFLLGLTDTLRGKYYIPKEQINKTIR